MASLEALGQPDPFRTRYRDLIRRAVQGVVQNKMNKEESFKFISEFVSVNVLSEDQGRFMEIIEIEVNSLHEGNFARFRIRPSEFFEWQKAWS